MARCRVPAPVAGGGTVNPRLPRGDISRVLHMAPPDQRGQVKRSRCCGGRRTRGGQPDVEAAPGRTKTPAGVPGKTLPGAAPAGAAGGGPRSRLKRT